MKYCLFVSVALLLLVACRQENRQQISIAILTPVTHPSLLQIEKAFKETLEHAEPGKYAFTTYNAQGNKTLMRSEVEEMMSNKYALVLTVGSSASQMTRAVFAAKGIVTPIVFTCVNDPRSLGLVGEANVTGVEELLNFEKGLGALLKLKPNVKQLLLVYNPSEPGLQKDRDQIEELAHKQGLKLTTVEIFQTNEIKSKSEPFMQGTDVVIVLKDNTVVSGLDALIKLCNSYKVPLMASDLDSPARGAAFAYGVYESEFGKEAALKVLQMLRDKQPIERLSVTPINHFELLVNKQAALMQGIEEHVLRNY